MLIEYNIPYAFAKEESPNFYKEFTYQSFHSSGLSRSTQVFCHNRKDALELINWWNRSGGQWHYFLDEQ